jgi:predicted RNA-binding protein YlqC (UPF0109 family)
MISDTAYLEQILKGLITSPEGLEVVRTVDDMGVLFSIRVAPADMGRIIGKSGSIAKAIRTIMTAFGFSNHEKISVKIFDPKQQ